MDAGIQGSSWARGWHLNASPLLPHSPILIAATLYRPKDSVSFHLPQEREASSQC